MNPITSMVLNLNFKPSYVPKSIANFLYDLSKIDNESDKLTMLSDYICKQEEELRRVEALNIELPQFRLLLMDAIKTLKEEFKNIKDNMESGSEQANQHLVEYLPTKRKNDAEEQLEVQREIREAYLAEVEYWNPNHAKKQKTLAIDDFLLKDELEPLNKRENSSNPLGSSSNEKEKEKEVAMDESSKHQPSFDLNDPTLNYHPKPLTQPIWKYNRRHWTPELHARFVEALNLLGGIEVATPKKIRDLMQVQELTVDQVKSHLQKYRLHCGKLLTSSLQ